ncbi:MAG: hypothetical protein E6K83_05480 [Thaumarchaeota archaeon]|nr:MAG: hypothetical protein E6K83_05480 [Nitrososphaerota archaeon]
MITIPELKLIAILVSILLIPPLAYGEYLGSIAVDISYTNGDRADYSSISMKVYQDFSKTPYKEIEAISGNPFNIISLPTGHQYKIVVYANGMSSGVGYVTLQESQQDVHINIPIPGGMRLNLFYNDGETPISSALISLKSSDNKTWVDGITDVNGRTVRFWVESTTENEHYTVDVKIGKHLLYSYFPLVLQPGIPQEIKIVTPWQAKFSSLVTVQLFNQQGKTVSISEGSFAVDLLSESGEKILQSKVNQIGEADFSNLKVGDYVFRAINLNDNSEWGRSSVTIDGTKTNFSILKNQTSVPIVQPTPRPTISSCNCVAFRLDNVQDYWLDNVQTKIIDTFAQKNTGITLGVIVKVFGNDSKLINDVKSKVASNTTIEIGVNGWSFEDFTSYNKTQQTMLLHQSKDKITSILGVTPFVFIPPFGKINNDTFYAMDKNGFTFDSAITGTSPPALLSDKIHNIPATVFTGYTYLENGTLQSITNDNIINGIQSSMQNYGFAVVTLNFQDYAANNGTRKENAPDLDKISKIQSLLDKVHDKGFRIATLSEVGNILSKPPMPSWIKDSANSWSEGNTPKGEFLKSIEYLVKEKIIQGLPASTSELKTMPDWVKHIAKWWSSELISDDEFINGIEFLLKQGIIN